jgi:hypothetical protein
VSEELRDLREERGRKEPTRDQVRLKFHVTSKERNETALAPIRHGLPHPERILNPTSRSDAHKQTLPQQVAPDEDMSSSAASLLFLPAC